MMDDVATPIIDPQEIPRGETMSKSDDKIALPKRISEPGTNGGVLDRINKRSNLKLVGTVENVLGREFKKLEDSFLARVIKMGRRQKHMVFSRHLIHHLLLRRIDIGKKGLWFSFGEQLMRFSLREFHLATGLPCVVDKDEEEVETSATKNKKKDPWMKKNQTLNTLLNLLVKKSTKLSADQRLWLGATILVEGILMASNPVTSIPEERLLRARNFKEFCKYPWGNLAFDYLRKEVESFTYTKLTKKDQYAICGFIYPLQLWALSSVNQLGTFFDIMDDEIQFPLCLHWIETKSLTTEEVNRFDKMEKVDVKCILGDPELHSDLVEDVDTEVDENNSAPGIDATDQEQIEFLTKKVNGQNADYEVGDTEILQNYKEAKRQEIAKDGEVNEDASKKPVKVTKKRGRGNKDGEVNEDASKKPVKVKKKRGRGNKGMKKGVTPPREVQQQVEDDAEDGEVNEDASKKPVKFTKKRGRGNKDPNVDTSKSKRQKKQEDSAGDVIGRVLEDLKKKPIRSMANLKK
uniref:DUF1985 domain-containing protein n=1 Tax=Brassica oleracea var. oleracea TaxID=109376 RepID=A0A0D2ZSQ3_BRAOL